MAIHRFENNEAVNIWQPTIATNIQGVGAPLPLPYWSTNICLFNLS